MKKRYSNLMIKIQRTAIKVTILTILGTIKLNAVTAMVQEIVQVQTVIMENVHVVEGKDIPILEIIKSPVLGVKEVNVQHVMAQLNALNVTVQAINNLFNIQSSISKLQDSQILFKQLICSITHFKTYWQ